MVKQEGPKADPTVESKPETTVPETVDEAEKTVEQPQAPGNPEKAKVEGKQAEVATQGTEDAPEKVVPEAEVPPQKEQKLKVEQDPPQLVPPTEKATDAAEVPDNIEQEPPKLLPPEPPAEKAPAGADDPPKYVKYIRPKMFSFMPVLKIKRDPLTSGRQKTDSLKEVLEEKHNVVIESVADSLWRN